MLIRRVLLGGVTVCIVSLIIFAGVEMLPGDACTQFLGEYQADEELLRNHYCDLVDKKFFPSLLEYMLSGPVTCMVWEGENAVKMGRQMLGATNPQESMPGTIRGDYSIVVGRNICHGSDSVENAEKEIKLWFKEGEVCEWGDHSDGWVYE